MSLFIRFLADAGYVQFPPEIETGAALVERFGEALAAQGYLPPFIELNLGQGRHFITWLYLSDIPVTAVDMAVAEDFVRHDCQCVRSVFFRGPGRFSAFCNRDNHSFTRLFTAFLTEIGIVASPASPEPGAELDPNIAAFCDWLRQHRGLHDKTVYSYGKRVSALFAETGADPGCYDVALIRDVLSRCLKTRSRGTGRNWRRCCECTCATWPRRDFARRGWSTRFRRSRYGHSRRCRAISARTTSSASSRPAT